MQLEDDRQGIAESQLIGNAVLDRQGYLLGYVIAVNALPDGQFALVVQFPASSTGMDNLTIESHHLTAIELSDRTIYTDLDFSSVVPQQGKTIPLFQEKLTVHRQRHKLGEIVVRKVTETAWVQVPVQRERLVIQKEGEAEPLTEIPLGETRLPEESNWIQHHPERAISSQPMANQAAANQNRQPQVALLGQWSSIDGALQTLYSLPADAATTTLPIGVVLSLQNGIGLAPEPVRMEFASPRTAAQTLILLNSHWGQRCQGIRLERLYE